MSRDRESSPTPPVWRHKGDVETHVPTMSAAEKDWLRRNGLSVAALGDEVPVSAIFRFDDICTTLEELSVLRVIYASPRGQLTRSRLVRTCDPLGQRDIDGAIDALHARGHLKRKPGRGGPYALSEHVKAMVS